MSKLRKFLLYSFLTILAVGMAYLYIWEKPKLEKLVEKYAESFSKNDKIPFAIEIGRVNFSIIPLQAEFYGTHLTPKGDLKKLLQPLTLDKVAIAPSLIDLLVGKFWISNLSVEGAQVQLKLDKAKSESDEPLKIDLNRILSQIPISQVSLRKVALAVNYADQYFVETENLNVKAFNEKSSLVLSVREPNLSLKTSAKSEALSLRTEIQVMVTNDTISLSSIKVIKEDSYFVASGNLIYKDSPDNVRDLNIQSRAHSNLDHLKSWSNTLYPNTWFDDLKGNFKVDVNLEKHQNQKDYAVKLKGDINKIQIDRVLIGDFKVDLQAPNRKLIKINRVDANLAGGNAAVIENGKINLGDKTTLEADVDFNNAQLYSFMRDSNIAEIPVWLNLNGSIKCQGQFDKTLEINCPGALTVQNLSIKSDVKSPKNIVSAQKVNVAGTMKITEKEISYQAKAKLNETEAVSDGVINYKKGFLINYQTDNLKFKEIGPIADLKFAGGAKLKGDVEGNSDTAIFGMDIEATNFEFEDYFFGELNSRMDYKVGILFFTKLQGNIESTRYNGNLQVDLLADKVAGDIQLPFFRMNDVQQAILKKVDLKNRFTGSGSGRLRLDTPFDIGQLGFQMDARLFKGSVFGEAYNEATLKANAIDGIIIVEKAKLQREKALFTMKGTIDTELESKLDFQITNGSLQHSSTLKDLEIPVTGEFEARGTISGPLGEPNIKTTAQVENLLFNKKKYGSGVFAFNNTNQQTSLQFNIPNKVDFLVVFPDDSYENIFINANLINFDLAPLLAFSVADDTTRSYVIETSGEISGNLYPKDFWRSEFSSTIKELTLDYKANKIRTTIPTNVELKNGRLFLNEISFQGNKSKQYIKVTQPYTNERDTKFVIDSQLNIAFFKIFAPFFEKIDGFTTLRLELFLSDKRFKLIGNSYTSSGFIKFPGFPHPIENLSADVLFNENKVLINSISGQMAGGDVLGNGEITLKGGNQFDIFINSDMENVNLNFPEGFQTKGSGTISLSGSEPPFLLSGEYRVDEGLIDSNFSSGSSGPTTDLLEELLKQEITSPLTLNIDIDTKNPVEVRNALVEGYIIGNIKVFDKINAPRIKGEAHFDDDSIIKFNDQNFEVTSSSFEFEGNYPINPKLSLRSKTRMNGYDIDLFLQGRAQNPILTMTSQPPLPETQIISMLALGTLPNQFDQSNTSINTNSNTLNSTGNNNQNGFEVGTSMLTNNPLGKEIKEKTGFDVQFSSTFDDQNTATPKISVKRKLNKKTQLSFSSSTGSSQQAEGRLTYELSNDISTIFRVRNLPQDSNNNNAANPSRQNNSIGLDLEYKVEFD